MTASPILAADAAWKSRAATIDGDQIEPLGVIDVAKWQSRSPPAREWVVDAVVPRRNVTLLSGDGGLGKSLLAQMLLTACVTGKPWLGFQTMRCNVLGIFAEDEPDELQRRQADIMGHYQLDWPDLLERDSLGIESRVGEDNIIATYERWTNKQTVTPLYGRIRRAALDRGAQLVILDTVADFFGGNEIERIQVRQFVNLLRTLALEIDGAIILTSHPSNEGLKTGTGISGSTGWRNTVRSHLYLTRPKASDTEDGADDNLRVLRGMKANYSARTADIKLCWQNGVFVATEGGIIDRIAQNAKADRVVVDAVGKLTGMGIPISDSTGRNYAPSIIRDHGLHEGLSAKVIDGAIKRAMIAGKLRVEKDGPPSRQRRSLVPTGG